ncbi:DNA-processing protein DprA [Flavobacteriaceae bacterium]|nr:DNA-processing protein DprA [Flavobacteriaceae bacterium]
MKSLILSYLSLYFCEEISFAIKIKALSQAKKLDTLFDQHPEFFEKSNDLIYKEKAADEYRICQSEGIEIICFEHEDYPLKLKEINDPPMLLFVKGNKTLLHRLSLSIVGTRRASLYGKKVVEEICTGLKNHQPVIISGFARGIDFYAHRFAVENGLETLAVFATGIGKPYPKENLYFIDDILSSGGLLLSEQPFNSGAKPYNFVQRNRLIAALSQACIVVESRVSGGSLNTANLAYSYSIPVYAVPGRLQDLNSAGCLNLLKEFKAQVYVDLPSLLNDLYWDKPEPNSEILNFFPLRSEIHFETLLEESGYELNKLQQELLELEIQQKIYAKGFGYYELI